jgi:hypothetical protein
MMFAVLGAVVAGMLTAPETALAQPSASPNCAPVGMITSDDAKDRREKAINDAIVGLIRQNTAPAEIARQLDARFGVTTLTAPEDAGIAPMSAGTDVTVPAPQIIFDTCTRSWYVYASYHWNSLFPVSQGGDANCPWGNPCAVGGLDGFGLAFNRNVASVRSYLMQTWGTTGFYPVSTGRTWSSDANVYGVTFEGQDKWCEQADCNYRDYSFYHGEIFYSFSPGCGALQAFSRYGHDWSSTTINGFGVGPWSLSISWSSSSNRWSKASGPSNAVTPC